MWKALMVAIALALFAASYAVPALSEHYVPEAGEPVRVYMYCESPEEMEVFILNGEPELIADSTGCWYPHFPLMGIFNGDIVATYTNQETGAIYDIHLVDPAYRINEWGYTEEFKTDADADGARWFLPVYLAIRREGTGA